MRMPTEAVGLVSHPEADLNHLIFDSKAADRVRWQKGKLSGLVAEGLEWTDLEGLGIPKIMEQVKPEEGNHLVEDLIF